MLHPFHETPCIPCCVSDYLQHPTCRTSIWIHIYEITKIRQNFITLRVIIQSLTTCIRSSKLQFVILSQAIATYVTTCSYWVHSIKYKAIKPVMQVLQCYVYVHSYICMYICIFVYTNICLYV